jgi:hypothetical protein
LKSVSVGDGDVDKLMFFEHAEVVSGRERLWFVWSEEREVYLVEFLFGVVEFALG